MDTTPLWDVPRPISKGWRPSDIGESNDRILVAKMLGYRDLFVTEKLQRIFDAGNDIEARWVQRFKDIGAYIDNDVWLPWEQPGQIKLRGKVDILVENGDAKYIVEIKSIAPEGYRKLPKVGTAEANFENLMGIKGSIGDRVRKYMHQLQAYLFTMQQYRGILLFEDKGHQEFKDYEIALNQDFVDSLYNRLKYLQDEFWEKRVIPPWNGDEPKTKFGRYKTNESVSLEEFRGEIVE